MKKNKFFVWGVLAPATLVAVLTFGLVLAGCDNGTGGGNDPGGPVAKSITITDITELSGNWAVMVMDDLEGNQTATGVGTIAGGSLTVALEDVDTGAAWTGSGSYYLILATEGTRYGYTNGAAYVDESSLVKISITSANTSVAFTKLKSMSGG